MEREYKCVCEAACVCKHVCASSLLACNGTGSIFTTIFIHLTGVSESRRDLPAEAAAEGESGRSDPASWRDGGPERPAEGAQCPAEGTGGDHAGPEGLL